MQRNQIWGTFGEYFSPSLGKPEWFAVQKSLSRTKRLSKPEAGQVITETPTVFTGILTGATPTEQDR